MNSKMRFAVTAVLVLSGLMVVMMALQSRHEKSATNVVEVRPTFAQVPLAFEVNAGQTDAGVSYLARGSGYTFFLTPNDAVMKLQDRRGDGAVLRLKLAGANKDPQVDGLDRLSGVSNYFIGNDPSKWRTNVPLFSEVHYAAVYPGIDLLYHGNQRQLEYDFILAPGADPRVIRLAVEGADKIEPGKDGELLLHVGAKEVSFQKPFVYQEINGEQKEVAARFAVDDKQGVGFEIAQYDTSRTLIIDPVFLYSTYLGGSGSENGYSIAVDPSGSAYVTGSTNSFNFPVTSGAPQGTQPSDPANGNPSAFVTKFDSNGALVYSTYLGGSCTDIGYGIAVDAAGEAYVTGTTGSGVNPQSGMPDCGPNNNSFQ
jgi:hypothetical protein